ncbi:DNA-binding CsgD family transcriptional regulator [Nitrospirillum amazonense]|uniref:DNA-binding CsgD family transcriptional regulator n=2 Tax=Nitrospirillum amazonense TaxID=28077 RepID=A0A560EJ17_9PROT|nr:DNA-binding CsgD family transcriptional regulator [Nitrospirillum amazonense]
MGFEWFVYDMLVMPDGWGSELVCCNYPKAWVEHYVRERYTRDDIAMNQAMASVLPVGWSASKNYRHLTDRQRMVLDECADAGLKSGAVVPLHGPGPVKSVLAVSGSLSGDDFNRLFRSRRHELLLIGTHAHQRILKLGVGRRTPSLVLSPRETEVLTLTALGDSAAQIAGRLKISESTTNEYLGYSKKKLGAKNKVHAASIALSQGLIRL